MINRSFSEETSHKLSVQTSDDNDKYNRHGANVNRVRYMIISVIIMLCIIVLRSSNNNARLRPEATISKLEAQLIPQCKSQPWKPNEDMRGKCPGNLKPFASAATISECATTCCLNPKCITWQYRKDTGCLQGGDVRLGMEADGVPAWCSDHPPQRWQGQYLYKQDGSDEDNASIRKKGCSAATWNPNEQVGQCFGLGDVRKHASGSAEECRDACCNDDKCRAWQWTSREQYLRSEYNEPRGDWRESGEANFFDA